MHVFLIAISTKLHKYYNFFFPQEHHYMTFWCIFFLSY